MKFRVEHDTLAEAVAWVARALPSRPVVPILSSLRLDAGDDGLTLSCFDYELSATARLPADVAEPGTALVPGRLLAEIIRSLPGQPAEFRSDGDEVTLACGSAEFALVSLPTTEYPALPPAPPLAGSVDGGGLAAAVAQVLPATSRDDTLPMLTAVCLDIRGGVMTLAATDRYRLAVRDLTWQPASPQVRAIALVPARTLADAARVMAPGVPVSVAFGPPGDEGAPGRGGDPRPVEGMISFESGGQRLTGRLIAGEFIKYESRFPAGYGCRAEMPAASLIEAVRRVSLVADRASPVRLTFEEGMVALEAQTEGRARAVERVTASFHGDEPVIAFNPHYLLDGLTAAAAGAGAARNQAGTGGGPEGTGSAAEAPPGATATATAAAATVRLEFTSPAKPALITLADGAPGTNDGAGETGDVADRANDVAVAPASGGATPRPGFRYLVVPLRSPARA
jgi:DNA polymerase-3 subunit beta